MYLLVQLPIRILLVVHFLRKTIAPNALNLGSGEENLSSRGSVFYDGLTATTNLQFDNLSSTISFSNPEGIRRGDLLGYKVLKLLELQVHLIHLMLFVVNLEL